MVTRRAKREVNGDGPECPFCGVVARPDEASYFDERGFDLECDCGGRFHVQPECSWQWITRAKTFEDG